MPRQPAIITRLFGRGYQGPLSHYDEYHALELGAFAGFVALLFVVAPQAVPLVLAIAGIRGLREGWALPKNLAAQVRNEFHYFSVGAVLVFLGGLLLVRGVQLFGVF